MGHGSEIAGQSAGQGSGSQHGWAGADAEARYGQTVPAADAPGRAAEAAGAVTDACAREGADAAGAADACAGAYPGCRDGNDAAYPAAGARVEPSADAAAQATSGALNAPLKRIVVRPKDGN